MPVITRKMSRENREKYNNFQSRITERQGGVWKSEGFPMKGEPWVPPIHEKGYFIYRNVCPEIASPRILGSIKLRANKLARPIFNNGSNKNINKSVGIKGGVWKSEGFPMKGEPTVPPIGIDERKGGGKGEPTVPPIGIDGRGGRAGGPRSPANDTKSIGIKGGGQGEPLVPPTNDNKRNQVKLHVDNLNIATWVVYLESTIRSLCSIENLDFKEWNILQSLAGCKQQQAHTDYVPDPTFIEKMKELDVPSKQSKIPLLCLVALEPNTYLDIWENSIQLITQSEDILKDILNPGVERVRITLQPGDILIFRPDLVHAGSAYEIENVRLHVYLDSAEIPRTPNRTFIIHKHGGEWLRAMFSRDA